MALVFKKAIDFSNLISILASGLTFEEGNVPSCFTDATATFATASSLGGSSGYNVALEDVLSIYRRETGILGSYT